ncbi:hypothetical protein VTN31DRAFT_7271 [Thermomyces dupontii]|uniref:uncharacterized protein n=1 Tax=Talaromyces thermophilus TaxID=28565 RepID=UPI0037433AC6
MQKLIGSTYWYIAWQTLFKTSPPEERHGVLAAISNHDPSQPQTNQAITHEKIMPPNPIFQSPSRFLLIASIGNLSAPYTLTRHSAGHTLLDAVEPLLYERIGLRHAASSPITASKKQTLFYETYKCPSLMNISGPPVLRKLRQWMQDYRRVHQTLISSTPQAAENTTADDGTVLAVCRGSSSSSSSSSSLIDIDISRVKPVFRPTLVILHDELEAKPGAIQLKRGDARSASLRGHRGLISVFESLSGAGLLAKDPRVVAGVGESSRDTDELAVLRVGFGIGRPNTRERDAVSEYVLTTMSEQELRMVRAAAPTVVELLVREMYRT